MSNFYTRTKHLLKERNITITAMCETLHIKRETYNTNRTHGLLPRLDVATRIANFLEVPLDYLATGKDYQSGPQRPVVLEENMKKKFMIDMIQQLPDDNARISVIYDLLYLEHLEQQENNTRSQRS
ncbi:helix-turn-helix transcriptional regulator (plasmid) [Entomospira entomophila]|uniref:Helix-turn-helix transcriptional regulator n=1 Tax=Entomospira entomophila TaxID=2719988 RepID=A0A968GF75_9SPIO|nr:helix-turn-helix transcriptional regulator [Entomospira entomophilus]NIZ41344.1 helix-turn-helix transcriptional regulator [Entomospira entomophilus]WDI36245.1 helix-turn-helix transcriptional regulator [Entomospira entomophilus]